MWHTYQQTTPDVMHQLAMVAKFASETHSGDLADCNWY